MLSYVWREERPLWEIPSPLRFMNNSGYDEAEDKKTSVLYDMNREWPFDWDWNGLFLHDLPLLELPDTVLREVLGLVDRNDRRAMSHSCQKLRNLLVKNKAPDMDRRRQIYSSEFNLNSENVITVDAPHLFPKKVFDLPSAEAFVEQFCTQVYSERITIRIHSNGIFPKLIDGLSKASDDIWLFPTPTNDEHQLLIDAFMKYPNIVGIGFDNQPVKGWKEYCSTISKWAKARGIPVVEDYAYNLRIIRRDLRGSRRECYQISLYDLKLLD